MTIHQATSRQAATPRPSTFRGARLALAAAALCLVAAAAPAAEGPWYWVLYVQESFPKQTNTNAQIEQINAMFGSDFDTWDDIHNLNLGFQVFKQVAPTWRVGLQADYSRGSIDGTATVLTEAGPATLAFEQEYSIYADLFAVAHWLPCTSCAKAVPFVLGGVGLAYEKDTTDLTLRNDFIDEYLKVDNDGWFPSYTAGVGLDLHLFPDPAWYAVVGVAYVWSRLDHMVPAEGGLAPAAEVRADTDTTGPNYWIGFGKRW
jgi:opacity protein-like surface antigen